MSIRDSAAWDWGVWGEGVATSWLQEHGWFVAPIRLIDNGGAPVLIGQLKSHVLPDLQIAGQGQARWVEVKKKTAPVLYQITRTWRHGIDLSKWNAYLAVERLSGIPGDLAIVQERPGPQAPPKPALLIAPFEKLRSLGQPGTGKDGPMIYWDWDAFHCYPLTDCQVPPLPDLRKVVHPWEQKSKAGNAPRADEWGTVNPQEPLWVDRMNGQRKSSDPRKNPREQQGKDSCMSVAAPIVVGIGLLLLRLPRATQGERADPRAATRASGSGGAPDLTPGSGRTSSPP